MGDFFNKTILNKPGKIPANLERERLNFIKEKNEQTAFCTTQETESPVHTDEGEPEQPIPSVPPVRRRRRPNGRTHKVNTRKAGL